jgi:glucosamine--fructose-6-phosphate aminotransferase (isomerizing)
MEVGNLLGAVMAAEMAEQPGRLASLLGRAEEIADQVRRLVPAPLAASVLVARGSSDHAATTGRYLLELATGRPVASASPSVHTLYRARADFSGCLVVAASQSGRTPEIVTVVQRAREAGGRTLALTNDPAAPLAAVADETVLLGTGEERAVPATKTVTAQMAAFALVAQALGDVGFGSATRARLPDLVSGVLADEEPAAEVAEWLAGSSRLATAARGLLLGAAAEAALKVEECTGIFAAGLSAADLRHGPIATTTSLLPVLALAHPGPACADVLDLVAELRARGAPTRIAGSVEGSALPWPADLSESAAAVLAVVRGQQVALALARRLGRDPDRPVGLHKVTAT